MRRGAAILLVGSHLPLLHGEKPPSHPPKCVARPDLRAPSPAWAVGRAPGPGGRRQVRASPRVAATLTSFIRDTGLAIGFPPNLNWMRDYIPLWSRFSCTSRLQAHGLSPTLICQRRIFLPEVNSRYIGSSSSFSLWGLLQCLLGSGALGQVKQLTFIKSELRKRGWGGQECLFNIYLFGVPISWGPESPRGGNLKVGADILHILSRGLILNLDQTGRLSAFCARAGTIRAPFSL